MKKYLKLLVDQEPRYRAESVRVNGENRPRDIYDVMFLVAKKVADSAELGSFKEGFRFTNNVIVSWSPSIYTLILSLLGKDVVYLCWGVPCQSNPIVGFLKCLKLKLLLKNAKIIVVNDRETQKEIQNLSGRVPTKIHYVVDGEYYYFENYCAREEYVLVPGNNDRDETLVVELANRGYHIIRLTRDSRVNNLYLDKLKSPQITVQFNVSVEKVRWLYQNAKVVALPVVSNNHAAGQTSILEAISCGAPIVLSSGRTETIFGEFGSVTLCQTNSCDEWISAIEEAKLVENNDPGILKICSEQVKIINSPELVADSIVSEINYYRMST